MQGGYDEPDEPDSPCIKQLETWILQKKNEVWQTTLLDQTNSAQNITEYENKLVELAEILRNALNSPNGINDAILRNNGWPPQLLNCMNDTDISIPVDDMIQKWFIQFPRVRSPEHLEVLEKENAGLQ